MHYNEHVKEWIQVMCAPKSIKNMSSGILNSKNVNQEN